MSAAAATATPRVLRTAPAVHREIADCARVPIKRPLPCFVVVVHGVNDIGAAYEKQDEGICKGLSTRLNRSGSIERGSGDLLWPRYNGDYKRLLDELGKSNPAEAERLRSDPDAIMYRRGGDGSTWSPVIPFYWGYREESAAIRKSEWHGEWLDRFGNRLDKQGAKGGGPFVNATTNLPDMWAPGMGAGVTGVLDFVVPDPLRPKRGAPDRRYFVLAALRLAALVTLLRSRPETKDAAVNVIGHSQGCLVTLLAQAILESRGERPADCLVLNNPPYSLDEPFAERTTIGFDEQQTTQARVATLEAIVKFVHGKRSGTPSLDALLTADCGMGVAGRHWQPGEGAEKWSPGGKIRFAERDNRGKVYLYFSPDDYAVALLSVNGIGGIGLADRVVLPPEGRGFSAAVAPLMDELKQYGMRQRLFTRRARGGEPERVGQSAERRYRLKLAREQDLRQGWEVSLTPMEDRLLNGERLDPPCAPFLGEKAAAVDAIEASVAMSSGRLNRETVVESIEDPRPADRRGRPLGVEERLSILRAENARLDQRARATGFYEQNRSEALGVDPGPAGGLRLIRRESLNEMRERLMEAGAFDNPNTYHSGIVENPAHHEHVTAYDLAIGQPIPHALEENGWLAFVRAVADWRTDWTRIADEASDGSARKREESANIAQHLRSVDSRADRLIKESSKYYVSGQLPQQVKAAITLNLVRAQTRAERLHGVPAHAFSAKARNP